MSFIVFFWTMANIIDFCQLFFFCLVSGFSPAFLQIFVESLILAQDERWRRA